MRRVVISQPMWFPWVGLLEQIRLADVYVHYDDVQFSKGSFVNRVQLKGPHGVEWMTIPLEKLHLGQTIQELQVRDTLPWRAHHLEQLERSFEGAPFAEDAWTLARAVLQTNTSSACELVIASLEALADYFDIGPRPLRHRSSTLGVPGRSWERVLATVRHFDGDVYVSGAGGRAYLDHEAFEAAGVRVEYMKYLKLVYPQGHGAFTPFVSSLDLIAHRGRDGRANLASESVHWKELPSP